jgi:hypothetical protein
VLALLTLLAFLAFLAAAAAAVSCIRCRLIDRSWVSFSSGQESTKAERCAFVAEGSMFLLPPGHPSFLEGDVDRSANSLAVPTHPAHTFICAAQEGAADGPSSKLISLAPFFPTVRIDPREASKDPQAIQWWRCTMPALPWHRITFQAHSCGCEAVIRNRCRRHVEGPEIIWRA